MTADSRTVILPVLLITVGIGWLLSEMGVAPDINWVWTLGLGVVGFLTFVLYGFDKVTFPIGAFFIIASIMSVLRQAGRLSLNIEVPVLVIAAGVLLLACRHPSIPVPRWLDSAGTKRP